MPTGLDSIIYIYIYMFFFLLFFFNITKSNFVLMPIQDFKTPSTLCYVYIIDVSVNDEFLARFEVNKVVKQSIFFITK